MDEDEPVPVFVEELPEEAVDESEVDFEALPEFDELEAEVPDEERDVFELELLLEVELPPELLLEPLPEPLPAPLDVLAEDLDVPEVVLLEAEAESEDELIPELFEEESMAELPFRISFSSFNLRFSVSSRFSCVLRRTISASVSLLGLESSFGSIIIL